MNAFRGFLIVFFVALGAYTLQVGVTHGWDLIPVFIQNVLDVSWSGQFNLDFMGFLLLAALWIVWRHDFSAAGFALAACIVGGMLFLCAYLLIVSFQVKGNVKALLIGERRASE